MVWRGAAPMMIVGAGARFRLAASPRSGLVTAVEAALFVFSLDKIPDGTREQPYAERCESGVSGEKQ